MSVSIAIIIREKREFFHWQRLYSYISPIIDLSSGHKNTSQDSDVVLCNIRSNPTEKLVNIFMGVARHEKVDFHLQRRKYTHCIRFIYSVRLKWIEP